MDLDQLQQEEEQIRKEIAEREEMAKAFALVRARLASKQEPPRAAQAPTPAPPTPSVGVDREVPKPTPQKRIQQEAVIGSSGELGKADRVRLAIAAAPSTFTMDDVASFLDEKGLSLSRLEIAWILSRLKARGEVVAIEQGTGQKPSVFRKNLPTNTTKNTNGRESLHAKEANSHP